MKNWVLFFTMLLSFEANAAGGASHHGFTWFGPIAEHFGLPIHVVTFIFVALILIVAGLVYRARIAKISNAVIPDVGITFRNIIEAYGQFIYGQCRSILGEKEAPKYFPFAATFFIVILISNLLGLVPGFLPPTQEYSTTFAMGVCSFFYYTYRGIRSQGIINYLKHFAGPFWFLAFLIFPLEVVSDFIRPFTLAIRLKGNMMGDHLVLSIFTGLVPALVPIMFMALGLIVCVIQSYVFMLLSIIYISLALPHDHGGDHGAEQGHGSH